MTKSRSELITLIQNVNAHTFDLVAMEVFKYQIKNNQILREFAFQLLDVNDVNLIKKPVYLPINGFKNNAIKSGKWREEHVFFSSSTGNQGQSKHYVRNIKYYIDSCLRCWHQFYGDVSNYEFLCLLPGYLERGNSSLIAMMEHFVNKKGGGGFYLYDHKALFDKLSTYKSEGRSNVILFGVSYALLDFLDSYTIDYPDLIVMETGGMKGTRREMLKSEFHNQLKNGFGVDAIHSEYGMTELFSQSYSKGGGRFYSPNSVKIESMQITDPLMQVEEGKTGILRITDLNNIDTCSFIQTDDLCRINQDHSFNLMGRLDDSDIRGCNLMVV